MPRALASALGARTAYLAALVVVLNGRAAASTVRPADTGLFDLRRAPPRDADPQARLLGFYARSDLWAAETGMR